MERLQTIARWRKKVTQGTPGKIETCVILEARAVEHMPSIQNDIPE